MARSEHTRSSRSALAYLFLIWTIVNSIPLLFLGFSVWLLTDPDETNTPEDVATGIVVLVLVALVVAGVYGVAWRHMGRTCRLAPGGSGLLVRGFLRNRTVAWDDLLKVVSTRFESHGRAFYFAKTKLVFRTHGRRERVRTAVVSIAFASSPVPAQRVLTWLPAGHPLRQDLPAALRDARQPPACSVPDVATAPVRDRIHPQRALLVTYLALVGALIAGDVLGAAVLLIRGGGVAIGFAVVLGVLLVPLGVLVVRVARLGIELTDDALVVHAALGRRVVPRAAITAIEAASSGAGAQVIVKRIDGPELTLQAGAGYGAKHTDAVRARLERWWKAGGVREPAALTA